MDTILIEQLKKGDSEAYGYIYKNYYALLCYIASGYMHDDFLAETIVGDVIYHLWEQRESLVIRTSLRSYLIKAVRNRCLDTLDLKMNKVELSFSSLSNKEEALESYVIDEQYPLDSLFCQELEHILKEAIDKLPKESKQVFLLSRFGNKNYVEISKELNISVNTVKYHIKNALSLLRLSLDKYLLPFLLFILHLKYFLYFLLPSTYFFPSFI